MAPCFTKIVHTLTHFEVREEALMLKNVAFTWLAIHFPIYRHEANTNVYVVEAHCYVVNSVSEIFFLA